MCWPHSEVKNFDHILHYTQEQHCIVPTGPPRPSRTPERKSISTEGAIGELSPDGETAIIGPKGLGVENMNAACLQSGCTARHMLDMTLKFACLNGAGCIPTTTHLHSLELN